MDERTLIKQAKNADADAFCRLYSLYKSRLYRYAFYRLGNESDAEDAVAECVLAAWKQISQLREPDAFAAWIFRILSACCGRLIQQQIRQRKQAAQMEQQTAVISLAAGNGSDQAGSDTWLILQEALDQLSDKEREIVLLSAVGGLNSSEIAQMTDLTAGSVRSVLSRSLKKVRGYFS
ncbi:MAG: RNA polymerase sigma factor [Firmicutes bacterium]|nr:RNA polymerase sigma factor [Bacillota bacterium]